MVMPYDTMTTDARGLFLPQGLSWISNYIYHKVWDEITHLQTSMVQPLKFGNG